MEGGALDPPDEVLVNRYVLFIDEVAEVIKERGEPPLSLLMASALKGVPPCERQATMQREMLRYRAVVELPAEAILRERKAFRPSAVKKVAVAFTGGDDPVFYRDALEGIETHLLQAADPPQVTSLALRVSWPRDSALRSFPPGALIANADRNILVFYVGPYRPLLSMRGFYLVYDASVNSVAVIPQLPSQSVSMFSHSGIGTGVAVLRHGLPTEYLLAELLLQRDRGRTSCKATLFMWWSSGPAAGRWTQKEVVLPLPSAREEHTSMPTYTFCADTVFAVGNAGLCWVDLLQGILMCDDVLAAQPQFWFIPLPMEKYIRPDAEDRGQPEAHRSMCCVKRSGDHILKFVIMDRNGQHQDHSYVTITTWLLPLISVRTLKWKKSFSVCYGELLDGTALLMPTYPILSMVNDNVVYITVAADLESMHGRPKDIGRYVLSLDMKYKRVSSSFKLPTASGRTPTYIFASTFSSYLHKSLWNEAQQKNEEETSNCSDCIKLQKRVVLPESQKPVLHPPIIDVVRDDVWMPGPTRRCFRSFPHRLSAPGQPSLGSSNSGTATSSEMGLASLTDDPSSTGRTSSA